MFFLSFRYELGNKCNELVTPTTPFRSKYNKTWLPLKIFFHQLFVANITTLSKRSKKKAREIILFWI